MAKKGVKVKELARELQVTSRRVIDLCRAAGIPVQNSITRLTADAERMIRREVGAHGPVDAADEGALAEEG